MDGWVAGDGAATDSLSHFSWHAALHELSLGDLDAVRRRYDAQLRPEHGLGCRALVDTGSLLFRWALTPGADGVPDWRRWPRVDRAATTSSGRPRRSSPCTPPSRCSPSTTRPACARWRARRARTAPDPARGGRPAGSTRCG